MILINLPSGKTVEGNEIEAFISNLKGKKFLYLLGGTHGDEVEGIFVLQKIKKWIDDDLSLKDLPIVLVPILNYDGYLHQRRVNSHMVDLNRNYPTSDWTSDYKKEKYHPGPSPLSEPENQFLNDLFEDYPPGFCISFHSWKPIINYNGKCKKIAEYLSSHNNYPISEDIGYATPGSLGTYLPEKFDCPVITFECPVLNENLNLDQIWMENEAGLKKLLESDTLREYFN